MVCKVPVDGGGVEGGGDVHGGGGGGQGQGIPHPPWPQQPARSGGWLQVALQVQARVVTEGGLKFKEQELFLRPAEDTEGGKVTISAKLDYNDWDY